MSYKDSITSILNIDSFVHSINSLCIDGVDH